MSSNIERAIYRGRGIEAKKLGGLYDVYRNGELLYTRFPVLTARTTKRDLIKAAVSLRDIVFVTITCDATQLRPRDVLIGPSSYDRYILSYKDFLVPSYGYRCEIPITVRRPYQGPAVNDVRPYGGRKKETDINLVYNNTTKQYEFSSEGVSATVYASKSRVGYSGSMPKFNLPEDVRISRWCFVMEILPGITIEENDYINYQGQDFMVVSVDKQEAGFEGQVVFCDLVRG